MALTGLGYKQATCRMSKYQTACVNNQREVGLRELTLWLSYHC